MEITNEIILLLQGLLLERCKAYIEWAIGVRLECEKEKKCARKATLGHPNSRGFKGVAAACANTRIIDRSSCVGYRSILVLTSLANTRADQSKCRLRPAPIRTTEW